VVGRCAFGASSPPTAIHMGSRIDASGGNIARPQYSAHGDSSGEASRTKKHLRTTRGSFARRWLGESLIGLVALLLMPAILTSPAGATTNMCGSGGVFIGTTNSCSYTATGVDTFTVPAGWTEATFDTYGASGGSNTGNAA